MWQGRITRRSALLALAVPAMIPSSCSRSEVGNKKVPTEAPVAASPIKELPRDLRPFPPTIEPLVRIKVADVRSIQEVDFGSAGQRLWITAPGTDVPGRACRGPVRLRRTSAGWSVRWSSGGRGGTAMFKTSGSIAMVRMDRNEPGIEFKGRRLMGTIHVEPIRDTEGRTEFDVICHLPMESYLPGVVEKELYPSWLPATFEAQAIAARSFAVCERAFWIRRRHYDLVAGQASQAWTGGDASARAVSAVRSTVGQLLVWRGQVVPAYYSASCGGAPRERRRCDLEEPGQRHSAAPCGHRRRSIRVWMRHSEPARRLVRHDLAQGLREAGRGIRSPKRGSEALGASSSASA